MKKIGLIIVLFGVLFFNTGKIFAQSTPEDINGKFFTILKDKGIDNAFEYLNSSMLSIETNQDLVNQNKNGLIELTKSLGNYYGYEQLTKDKTGESYIKYSFLLKYEKSPVKFTMTYYKPNDTWKVYEISYNKQLDDKNPIMRQMPLRSYALKLVFSHSLYNINFKTLNF